MSLTNKFLHEVERLDSRVHFKHGNEGWITVYVKSDPVLVVSPYMRRRTMKVPNYEYRDGRKREAVFLGYEECMRTIKKTLQVIR